MNLSTLNKNEISLNMDCKTPALIIETNISYDNYGNLADHQSRVIEITSWKEYCDLFVSYNGDYVGKQYKSYGLLSGCVLPKNATIQDLKYDDYHLSCKMELYNKMMQYKLAYILEREVN